MWVMWFYGVAMWSGYVEWLCGAVMWGGYVGWLFEPIRKWVFVTEVTEFWANENVGFCDIL